MANFCSNCGAPTNPSDKFCMNCGNRLTFESIPSQTDKTKQEELLSTEDEKAKVASQTGTSNKNQKLKQKDNLEVQRELVPDKAVELAPKQSHDTIVAKMANETQCNNYNAPVSIGETALENNKGTSHNMEAIVIPGPIKVIGDSLKRLFQSIKALFKDPKKMIPMLIIALVWIVLDILKACNINPVFTQILSFITFASGGMNGGIIGAIGGIIGKGIFAGAFTFVIGYIFQKNKGEKKSFKDIMKGSFGVSLGTLFAYLTGIGFAMLLFLFISGGALRISFMGGIAVMIVSSRAALHNGFLQKFINSIFSKGKAKQGEETLGIIRGMAIGSGISAFIGLIGINLILIIIGSILFVFGIIMTILQKKGVIKFGKGENTK